MIGTGERLPPPPEDPVLIDAIGAGAGPPWAAPEAEAMRGAGTEGAPTFPTETGAGTGDGAERGEAGALANGLGILKGVGAALGAGEGDGALVGLGVGVGRGVGDGDGVLLGVGVGRGVGLGLGLDLGVGDGALAGCCGLG